MLEQKDQLKQIEKNMPVYDNTGKKFGKVSFVHAGSKEYLPDWNTTELDDISPDVINELSSNYPEEVNERLLQSGFVKVKTGFLLGARYVLPEHISDIRSGEVHLNVEEDLIPRF